MIRNFVKIAFRSLLKNKAFTLINIFGLFIGLTAFLLIYAYVSFEQGYDQHHQDAERIYRVTTWNIADGVGTNKDAMSFSPMGSAMMDDIAGVEQYTTTMKLYESLIFKVGDELVNENDVIAADERFFDIFSYKLTNGEENPFKDPNSLVLTKSAAMRLFGHGNPVGETMEVRGIHAGTFKITGVMDDPPGNTHYKFKVLMSFKTIEDRAQEDGWRGFNFYTYVKLSKGTTREQVLAQLPAIKDKFLPPELTLGFFLQPLTDIHLEAGYTYEAEPSGNARTVGFLLVIALFIIVIAWVNYINLSTAKAMDRAKEVGLRKVVGAGKFQLIVQFLLESLFINLFAAILALTALQLLGPVYNNLLGKDLTQAVWTSGSLVQLLLGITVVGSLLSGFYPAMVLSSFKPITALKGKLRDSSGGILLRKGLVVFQFVASLILIAGTTIVYMQIDYMKSRDLGVDIDHAITLRMPPHDPEQRDEYHQKYERLRSELERSPNVMGVATASAIPGGGRNSISGSAGGLSIEGVTEVNRANRADCYIDNHFFAAIGAEIIAGRNYFDPQSADRAKNIIVNEALLDHLGFEGTPEEALNLRLKFGGETSERMKTIIGVVKNYNRRSLKDDIEPTVFHLGYDDFMTSLVVKLSASDLTTTLAAVKEEWLQTFPNVPFDYSFMDQNFDAAYKEDQQFGSIFGTFSILAMAIAGLGLLGLSSFIAIQRSKEIGVRKVLGASVANIVKLISKDFLLLVGIAFLIGSPLVYLIMDGWLDNYAFRIDLPLWTLPVSGFVLLLITFLTVAYQTARAASANPVDTLRFE